MEMPGEKLLIKLWETLAEKGIGSLLSPWQTIRDGKARSEVRKHELLLLAQADSDAADIRAGKKRLLPDGRLIEWKNGESGGPTLSIESTQRIEPAFTIESVADRGLTTAAADAARAEINATKAVIYAEELLAADAQEPPERGVDEDWILNWRENAGRVSNEDLQKLWGSVLAGEVKAPGTYSIRTLDFLRTLSKTEAEQISLLATYAVEGRIIRSQKAHLDAKGVTFDLLLRMQELGVVSGVEAVGLSTKFPNQVVGTFVRALRSHGKALVVKHDDATKEFQLEVYLLTSVGAQVLGLGSFTPDIEYLVQIGKQVVAMGFTVQLADWKQVSEWECMYFNEVPIDAS
jgi:hypothetical protein